MSSVKRSIVDTDVWIRLLRRDSPTRDFFKRHLSRCTIVISAITIAELHAGQREEERERLYWGLRNARHAEVTTEIAMQAGAYRRQFFPSHNTELSDCLIAATAKVWGAYLVTYNAKHFPMSDIRVMVPG